MFRTVSLCIACVATVTATVTAAGADKVAAAAAGPHAVAAADSKRNTRTVASETRTRREASVGQDAQRGADASAGTDAHAGKAKTDSGDGKPPGDVKLSGMSILGNQDAPKSLVIVPWQSATIGRMPGLSMMLDDSVRPVEKRVFMRELAYYQIKAGAK